MQQSSSREHTLLWLLACLVVACLISQAEGDQFDKRQDLSFGFSIISSNGSVLTFPSNNSLQTLKPTSVPLPDNSYTMMAACNSPDAYGLIVASDRQVAFSGYQGFHKSLDVGPYPLGKILAIAAIPTPKNASFGMVVMFRVGLQYNVTFFRSSDGGRTWTQLGSASPSLSSPPTFGYISFTSAAQGIAVVNNLVFATRDGASWSLVHDLGTDMVISDAYSVPDTPFTVVSGKLKVTGQPFALYTKDGGLSWSSVFLPINATGITATSPSQWVICGQNQLYITTDGGQTWSLWWTSSYYDMWVDVAVTSPDIVMVVGYDRNPNFTRPPIIGVHLYDWVEKEVWDDQQWAYSRVVPGAVGSS